MCDSPWADVNAAESFDLQGGLTVYGWLKPLGTFEVYSLRCSTPGCPGRLAYDGGPDGLFVYTLPRGIPGTAYTSDIPQDWLRDIENG